MPKIILNPQSGKFSPNPGALLTHIFEGKEHSTQGEVSLND